MATAAGAGLTAQLAQRALSLRFDDLPPDVRRVARDCIADFLACTFAGLAEPAGAIVAELARDEGGHPQAAFIGRGIRGSVLQAALVNGTTAHALDYDDVHLAVPGHMSVAILPALLALAEQRGAGGAAVLAAFVAGFETACRIGKLVEPAHYANGFHATATIGSLGAAMACAHLLQLPPQRAAHAMAVAATQAAGLKAMFGTMAKPLHAGLAAQGGLRAALLAGKGFEARADGIECIQGFAQVHGSDFRVEDALAQPEGGFHLLRNLFKFHAACYSVHAAIEAVAALRREHGLQARSVTAVRIVAGDGCSICNIQSPVTALEAKFSLRIAAAFALLGIDTSGLSSWGRMSEADVVAVRDRVRVELVAHMGLSDAQVTLHLDDGTTLHREYDAGEPMRDKALQSSRIREKFAALAGPVVGDETASQLVGALEEVEHAADVRALLALCGQPALRGTFRS